LFEFIVGLGPSQNIAIEVPYEMISLDCKLTLQICHLVRMICAAECLYIVSYIRVILCHLITEHLSFDLASMICCTYCRGIVCKLYRTVANRV